MQAGILRRYMEDFKNTFVKMNNECVLPPTSFTNCSYYVQLSFTQTDICHWSVVMCVGKWNRYYEIIHLDIDLYVLWRIQTWSPLFWLQKSMYLRFLRSPIIWMISHDCWSTLAQIMTCCLTAPSHYLNQCWQIICEILWHSSDGSFTRNSQDIYPWYEIYNH